MKLRLLILLAAVLAAAPAAGQTIKSLGYNTTNGQVVYSGSNSLTFTNALQFSTNARAATRTNLGGTTLGNSVFTATNTAAAQVAILGTNAEINTSGGLVGITLSTNETKLLNPISFPFLGGATAAATSRTNLELGATNNVTFSNITASGIVNAKNATLGTATNAATAQGIQWSGLGGAQHAAIYGAYDGVAEIALSVGTTSNALSDVATFRATGMTVNSNAIVGGTLAVTGDTALSGVNNTMPGATNAASASSLMTRELSDVRYLGEMWNASKMAAYATTNPSVTVFLQEAMVTYTNGQAAGPYMHEFLSAEKYAGKTVRLLAYCRVNSTNGGDVQGGARIIYLTNTAGPSALSLGGTVHGTIGVFTNAGTDVFPVATSTNQYLIFTSNVGTIPTNAKMILASFAFNRASTNTTFTNNLYMQAVQLVVEP